MNILNITFSDHIGGASIAAYRMHKELLKSGIQSRMLVADKATADEAVAPIIPFNKGQLLNRIGSLPFEKLSLPGTFNLTTLFLKNNPLITNWAEIILLRSVIGNYLSESIIPFFAKHAPIVWRLPDMWAVTGHCAYSFGCERWKIGCGKCPGLDYYPPIKRDTSSYLWKRKKRLIQKSNITVVTPSLWLKEIVEESPIFENKKVVHIASGVDTDFFKPVSKHSARTFLHVKPTTRVLLFSDPNQRKGAEYIIPLLEKITEASDQKLTLLMVGARKQFTIPDHLKQKVEPVIIGYFASDHLQNLCYNAADVFVMPTLADNLPNSLIEASACGTPSVVFDVGGCGEVIQNGKSGYTIEPKKLDEMANKIIELLEDSSRYDEFSKTARQHVVENFSMNLQVKKYTELFKNLIIKAN